ncbi:phospho-sugar mutase [Streptomyces sp. AC563]|uniref:phospho-sugar mutase n=1 Tax=Streptomyces buecherae TaxID=2763006 RepID=UPI00164DD400|nr:phospho-sugar mutase [Streptomyces buecherae]MBC3991179.1 phospho-sugar mutase [Streptomyces buecherae]
MQHELIARARDWLSDDPDPDTRQELTDLIEAGAGDELAARFAGTLQFGTAGLRAELGAGPMRMNRAVVIRAAAGLASYLNRQRPRPAQDAQPAGGQPGPGLVVIGYDARHRSADFARDTAAVMVGAGLRAVLLPRPLPTPVLAFAIRHLGAVAGVEVTASHNPPRDNGYKVYLGDGVAGTASRGGSQIVPPADAEIATEIAAVAGVHTVPRPDAGWEIAGEEVVEAYLERAASVLTEGSPRAVRVVYTPLHGVGRETLTAAFARAGFPAPTVVAEQAEPDPDFPTVAFPNPEEPGAMDLAFATARATAADAGAAPDLVIANDPDADRCAVAVPAPEEPAGWRMLRGDEVGALLAAHLVRTGRAGQGGQSATDTTFATTIVSSSLLSRIAATAGVPYAETLTGFKWLARVDGVRYAYEEALGYCVDPAGVRDKDGITAALLVAELAAGLRAEGRTLVELLDELALAHGLHATDQLSVRVDDLSVIAAAMERLRAQPPTDLAGLPVTSAQDLSQGSEALPPTDGLRYHLAGDAGSGVETARVIVRPSGTEPKLKCYLEVVLPVAAPDALPAARARAREVLEAVKRDLAVAAGI